MAFASFRTEYQTYQAIPRDELEGLLGLLSRTLGKSLPPVDIYNIVWHVWSRVEQLRNDPDARERGKRILHDEYERIQALSDRPYERHFELNSWFRFVHILQQFDPEWGQEMRSKKDGMRALNERYNEDIKRYNASILVLEREKAHREEAVARLLQRKDIAIQQHLARRK